MEEAGKDYDYRKLLRPGQKIIGETTLEGREEAAKDQASRVRATVVRKLHGRPTNQPVVTQAGFDENAEPTQVLQTMSTTSGGRRKLKRVTPIELEGISQDLLGIKDPKISAEARAQRAAIETHTQKP